MLIEISHLISPDLLAVLYHTNLYPVREEDELYQSTFQRCEPVDYGPPIGKVYIHSPEDLILYKLMYFGLSQQLKHSRDIATILKLKKIVFSSM